MEDLTPYLAFGSLVWVLTQLYKLVEAKQWKSVRVQVAALVLGIIATLLAAQTSFANGIPTFGGASLASATFWDQVFVGMTIAGVAGVAFSLKKAIDNSDSDKVVNVE